MTTTDLRTYLNQFHPLPEADYGQLTATLKTKYAAKGTFLVTPGQVQRELYFVRSGVQMSFFEAGHYPQVIAFTYAPGICAIPESFSAQAPSRYALTCLSDSRLDYLTFGELQALFDQSPPVERLFRRMTVTHFHLVVHDFGGPIGLEVAIRHPYLVGKIVVLNSWLWSSRYEPEFIRLRRLLKSPLLPFLYRCLNFSPRVLLPGSFGDHKLLRKIRAQYTKPFATPAQRNGALAFARSLLHDQDWFEGLWQRRQAISGKPTLLLWGMKDPVLPPKYLDKFRAGFPEARVQQLAGSGHFPQEEQPGQVAECIDRFLSESR